MKQGRAQDDKADVNVGEPWDRQPYETKVAFRLFRQWLVLDPRPSISMFGRSVQGRSESSVYKISAQYRWLARADAYDRHLEMIRAVADRQAYVKMRERHVQIAEAAQGLAAIELQKYLVHANTSQQVTLPISTVLRLIEVATRVEREARAAAAPGDVRPVAPLPPAEDPINIAAGLLENPDAMRMFLDMAARAAGLPEVPLVIDVVPMLTPGNGNGHGGNGHGDGGKSA